MEMETEYRSRLHHVHNEVKKRLVMSIEDSFMTNLAYWLKVMLLYVFRIIKLNCKT